MSFKLMAWAMKQPVSRSAAKFILVAMADCVSKENEDAMTCYPSIAYLARATAQDEKTVKAALTRLREEGFIEVTGEKHGATKRVVEYRLKQPENGLIADQDEGEEKAQISGQTSPKTASNGKGEMSPDFPGNEPVFPVKQAQISGQTSPKTAYRTYKEPSKEPSKEAGAAPARKKTSSDTAEVTHIDGVPDDLMADYLAVRKSKKAGLLTATAVKGLQREAEKAGLTLVQAIQYSCEANWIGFNAGWYAERNGGRRTAPAQPVSSYAGSLPQWCIDAGFEHIAQAQNARCHIGNFREFRDGKRIQAEELHA